MKNAEHFADSTSQEVRLRVNGESHHSVCPAQETLLETLRERLGLTGTKHGCELGECGACAVLKDGEAILSCLALTADVQDCEVVTIEGIALAGQPHPLQKAIAQAGAAQCGYCIPAIVLTAKVFLEQNRDPSRQEIREAIAGNLCRCTGYVQIVDAIQDTARILREREGA